MEEGSYWPEDFHAMILLLKILSIFLLFAALTISIVSLTAVLKSLLLGKKEPSTVFIAIWLVCVTSYQLYPESTPKWLRLTFMACLSITMLEMAIKLVGHVFKHLIQESRIHADIHEKCSSPYTKRRLMAKWGQHLEDGYTQWCFARFFAGWLMAWTNAAGGFQNLCNWSFIAIAAIPMYLLSDIFIAGFAWKSVFFLAMLFCSVFLLWLALYWLASAKIEFPTCESGKCHGMPDFTYRFGTWLGLAGWRKWAFVCRCGHVYQVDHGKWKLLRDQKQRV
ncbi:MAG: hypothetical protein ILM98_02480 [Kiritimatiellae bacterium]|nr:hypothetical protein [Kiritimatiellia bacterium]